MHRALAIIIALGLTACSGPNPLQPDSVSATSPAAAVSTTGSVTHIGTAAVDTVTHLKFSVDLTVPAYPACALTPPAVGVIKGTGLLTILLRSTTDGNGGTHIGTTIAGHGTATDATGASWIWSDADLNNELFPSGNTSSNSFEQTVTEGFHVIGPNGQKIIVKGVFHITVVNGTTVVEVEKGNHEADEFCESGFVLTPLP